MKQFKAGLFETGLMISILIIIVLRVLLLKHHELWYDEALSILLSSGQKLAYSGPKTDPIALKGYSSLLTIPMESGLGDTVESIKNLIKGTLGDVHPPLFYLSQHGWMRLFGPGEFAQRSLVALTGLGSIAAAYGLGRTVIDRRGGLILAAMVGFNPFLLAHALNLRMYTLLLLWTVLSQWGLLALIQADQKSPGKNRRRRLLLMAGVALSVAGGLLTQYLFVYCLFSLGALVLAIGRRRWRQYSLTLATGVLLALPWFVWGLRQQVRNRGEALNQVSATGNAALRHMQDILQTLANHLLLGHWTTGFDPIGEPIKPAAVSVGLLVALFLLVCIVGLYRQRRYHLLATGVFLGLGPLLTALALDILSNKFTVGFGWGRSTIVAVPGCLLLITSWVMQLSRRWQAPVVSGLLALYCVVGAGDQILRERNTFRTVNHWVNQSPSQSTLIAMNSRAWGNVSRLGYYVDTTLPVDMLATNPADLAAALDGTLKRESYDRILWLNTPFPVWFQPKTTAEAEANQQATEDVLGESYKLAQTETVRGTMNLDWFDLSLYQLSSGKSGVK